MIKFFSLIAVISTSYSSFCQDTIFVSDYYMKLEGDSLKKDYKSLNVYVLHHTLNKELEDLLCNCKKALRNKTIQGFSILNLKVKEESLTLITSFTNWNLDNPSIKGVTFINKVPFLISYNYDFEKFLEFDGRQVNFQYYLNSSNIENLILSNLYDNSHPMEKYIILNGEKNKFIIDYCKVR